MRSVQRHPATRLGTALAVGALLVLPEGLAVGFNVVTGVLFLGSTAAAFAVLTIASDAIALRRRHTWRWWWRASDDQGPFWPGTRILRRP
ncbi:MAG TPA: hypothetical protein VFA49_07715 [Chloroflexota bacterium]|nr:hypothetical protein [Chloroflexota bacterium]